jgi:uncharacterized protein (TIGR00369 family)
VKIATHLEIDTHLCGEVESLTEAGCRVVMTALPSMRADASGLIHGGFIFGMADYAAMVAVNHPNVVLGAAETKFLKPVKVGDRLAAEAQIQERQAKKIFVSVTVVRGEEAVFQGLFTCFVLPRHVLAEN